MTKNKGVQIFGTRCRWRITSASIDPMAFAVGLCVSEITSCVYSLSTLCNFYRTTGIRWRL